MKKTQMRWGKEGMPLVRVRLLWGERLPLSLLIDLTALSYSLRKNTLRYIPLLAHFALSLVSCAAAPWNGGLCGLVGGGRG